MQRTLLSAYCESQHTASIWGHYNHLVLFWQPWGPSPRSSSVRVEAIPKGSQVRDVPGCGSKGVLAFEAPVDDSCLSDVLCPAVFACGPVTEQSIPGPDLLFFLCGEVRGHVSTTQQKGNSDAFAQAATRKAPAHCRTGVTPFWRSPGLSQKQVSKFILSLLARPLLSSEGNTLKHTRPLQNDFPRQGSRLLFQRHSAQLPAANHPQPLLSKPSARQQQAKGRSGWAAPANRDTTTLMGAALLAMLDLAGKPPPTEEEGGEKANTARLLQLHC
ncbi:hypothetical protein Anapl_02400 [Anas platyrhynchos]|uniref:Uncharacterized protein n=1 Tax=Anas platyrhynchos TaxID=8839 RepID=R0LL27_ANAPL|nr:hypothetical protein Anapl_02400 [Anas platyrhynchos]